MTVCRTALLCLLLTLLAPVGAGAAEDSVPEPTLLAPQAGELITGPLAVHVVTPPATGTLELRVLRGDRVLQGPAEVVDSTVTGGERHWRQQLDLSALPNGLVTVQVRPAATTSGEVASWTGVMVLLSAPPATPALSAVPGPDAGTVTATWEPLDVPDLLEARLERAGPGADTFTVEVALDSAALARGGQRVLTGLAPGEHRLRLTTARAGHDGPLEAASEVVTVPVEPAPHEPADESADATPEPGDTRVRATGGSEPRQVEAPVPAEAEPAPSPARERRAAMRPTASSREVGTAAPQVAAPQVAAPESASPAERDSPAEALARPPSATLTIGHPDRLVAERSSPGPLLALLLAGFMLARRTARR